MNIEAPRSPAMAGRGIRSLSIFIGCQLTIGRDQNEDLGGVLDGLSCGH
jgi:hypothetical protein